MCMKDRPIPALALVCAARSMANVCVRIGRTVVDGFQGCCLHNRRIGVPCRRIQITTHNARLLPNRSNSFTRACRRGAGSESECWREARCCVGTLLPTPPPRTLSRPLFSLFHEDCRRTCNMPSLSLRHHPLPRVRLWPKLGCDSQGFLDACYWLGDFIASALMPRSSSRVSSTVIRWLDNDNDDDDDDGKDYK